MKAVGFNIETDFDSATRVEVKDLEKKKEYLLALIREGISDETKKLESYSDELLEATKGKNIVIVTNTK